MRLERTTTLAVLCTGLLLRAHPSTASDGALAARLRPAADAILTGPAPGVKHDPTKPLTEVVEILSNAAGQAGLPAAVRAKLTAAHERLKSGGTAFDPGVTGGLGEAYQSLNGRRFAFPTGVTTFAEAKEACRREVESSIAALNAGRMDEAARRLLEFLMLVMTPLEEQ